jgi:hypothetical protein
VFCRHDRFHKIARSVAWVDARAIGCCAVSFYRLEGKAAAEACGRMLMTYHPGLLLDAMVVVGIVCFAGLLISLFLDLRSG